MAIEREIEALSAQMGGQTKENLKAKLRMAWYRRKVSAYADCFLGADGELTEAAQLVLGDVSRLAGLGVARLNRSTEQIHFDEGQRRIVLHVIENLRLDSKKLAEMARKIRET